MQARYSGGSTLTPGSPLLGSKPKIEVTPPAALEEPKEEKQRARPGRGGAAAAAAASANASADAGVPVAPLNVRASSTRIPAMKLPETPAPVETSSSPFLSAPEQPAPAKAFSPMDIFGSPADEPAAERAPEPVQYVEPAAAPDYTSAVQYNAGASYEYQNAQPIDPVPSPNPPAIGEITTSFFTPMGATEASLQPPAQAVPQPQPQPQPEAAPQQSPFLSTASDPTQQPQAAADDDGAQVQDLDEDEPDDTVKSINDALRGLFR